MSSSSFRCLHETASTTRLSTQQVPGHDVAGSQHGELPFMTRPALFKFRLYTADGTQNSAQALANLTALCQTHVLGRYEIEVVDVFREPERARADGIRMTPTLIKVSPAPSCRIIGSLSETRSVLLALGIQVIAA